jgi:hypothetical protein
MHDHSWLVWGRASSPVQDEQSSAAVRGHGNSGFAIAMIALVSLGLTFAAEAQSKTAPVATPDAKPATRNQDAQLYRNPTFAFRYNIPYGWVYRTKEMQAGNEAGKGEVLLAVFERPPEATGDTINSAVVIASESAASYPGLKKVEDYLGPLTELATAKGFKAEGEPYALDVESRHLLRADFVKPRSDKLTMRQCTLVLLAKGQIVSFTFIAGSEDELDNLMDGLHFGSAKPSAH